MAHVLEKKPLRRHRIKTDFVSFKQHWDNTA